MTTAQAIGFSCSCGALRGHVDVPSPRAGNHVICHCPDCRAAMIHLGQPDPAPDGVEIWQTTPDRVHITEGARHLALMRLSPKGMYRWYAACCNAPITTTLRHRRLNVGGLIAARLDDRAALGPLLGYVFKKGADGRYHHKGFNRMGLRVIQMILAANLSGRWRDNPFLDDTGKPVVEPRVLSREERRAASA
jgi:hypothetical protein